ncbi:MAG: macro domain-containing protein [Aureispira sp.]
MKNILKDTLLHSLSVFGVLWAILAACKGLNFVYYIILILLSILLGTLCSFCKNRKLTKISLLINKNKVEIIFGDIFNQSGTRAIPVSQLLFEDDVIENSIQDQLINNFITEYGSLRWKKVYQQELKESTQGLKFSSILRDGIKLAQYPIGTCFNVDLKAIKYIFVTLTKTEAREHIPSNNCTPNQVLDALQGFWQHIINSGSKNEDINIPLFGASTAGIGLDLHHILNLNLLSIYNATVKNEVVTSKIIRIVLHNSSKNKVDLRLFQSMYK